MKSETMERARASLDGLWKYKLDQKKEGINKGFFKPEFSLTEWKELKLPTNWYLTEIGDYHGVAWFQKEFEISPEFEGKMLTLRFNAVDYIADVWLNGVYLGKHEGFFAPFEFGVTPWVKFEKTNTLVVRVDSPRDPTAYVLLKDPGNLSTPMSDPYKVNWPADLTILKGMLIDCEHRPGGYTSFGQDGNSGGIWQSVELIATEFVKIESIKIYCKIVQNSAGGGGNWMSLAKPDDTALVTADIDVYNHEQKTIEANISMNIKGENFESDKTFYRAKEFTLQPGLNSVKLVKTIQEPKLWWCWDHGDPNLYQAEISVRANKITDKKKEVFGIRELEVTEDGLWHLNGRRIFARGTRYNSSIWMSEINRERYSEDLKKMRELNINAIRIGSHVEKPELYELCDRMGILVWQVFPMHYVHSDSDELIERAAFMMKEMVRLLYNHPSVVVWSVFKEPTVYPISDRPRPNNYGRLCQIMYEAGKTVDPIRWMHKGDYEEGVQNFTLGYCQPADIDVRKVNLRPMIVEFHTGELPCLETMKQIMPEEDLWPPNWDKWSYLNLRYHSTLNFQKIDMGGSLEEFIKNSGSYSFKMTKEQIEFLRQRKYSPVGSMFHYFWSDPYPCIGCGVFDYYGRPYKRYDAFKQVYTPVLVSLEWCKDKHILGRDKIYSPGDKFVGKIWITNDLAQEFPNCTLSWRIVDSEKNVLLDGENTIFVPKDASWVVDTLTWPIPDDCKGVYKVEMDLKDEKGKVLSQNFFPFRVSGL